MSQPRDWRRHGDALSTGRTVLHLGRADETSWLWPRVLGETGLRTQREPR